MKNKGFLIIIALVVFVIVYSSDEEPQSNNNGPTNQFSNYDTYPSYYQSNSFNSYDNNSIYYPGSMSVPNYGVFDDDKEEDYYDRMIKDRYWREAPNYGGIMYDEWEDDEDY